MHIQSEKIPNLLLWLSKELGPICDADSGTLAQYVVALLKNEKESEALKSHCTEQLKDFLKEKTSYFVRELFKVIQDDSFLESSKVETETQNEERDHEQDDTDHRIGFDRRRAEDEDGDEVWRREDRLNRNMRRSGSYHCSDDDTDVKKRRKNEEDNKRIGRVQSTERDRFVPAAKGGQGGRQSNPHSSDRGNTYDQQMDGHGPALSDRGFVPNRNGRQGYTNQPPSHQLRGDNGGLPQNHLHGRNQPSHPPHRGSAFNSHYDHRPDSRQGRPTNQPFYPPGPRGQWASRPELPLQEHMDPSQQPELQQPTLSDAPTPQDTDPSTQPRPAPPLGPRPNKQPHVWANGPFHHPPPHMIQPDAGNHQLFPPPGMFGYPLPGPVHPQSQQLYHPQYSHCDAPWGPQRQPAACLLQEDDRCTLRFTGIPPHVKESDIITHFKSFGRVIQLQVTQQTLVGEASQDRKTYNEGLVQFSNAQEAKKCFSSPVAVLNNRFIKLYQSNFNIIPPSDVSPPTAQELIEQQLFMQQSKHPPHAPQPVPVNGKFENKKYISPAAAEETNETAVPPVKEETPTEETPAAPAAPAAAAPLSKADIALQAQFEDLKRLREQAETIWRQKEALLQSQLDGYQAMVSALKGRDGDGGDITEDLEGKIVDLQSQLRNVRDQREKGSSGRPPGGQGGRWVRGRGRGGRDAGRGRGRGAAGGRNISSDYRPKAILIAQPPQGFADCAEAHFSRFGEVKSISKNDDDGIMIEFATRKMAEIAKAQGALFEGKVLVSEWVHAIVESTSAATSASS